VVKAVVKWPALTRSKRDSRRQARWPDPAESYNRPVTFDDYKVVLYRQDDGSWVAEIPALGGCYALMDTREAALAELEEVFALIAQEHRDRGVALPKDTTEIVHA
jgi:predicted RNase H-like HicB family nuclease